MISEGIYIRGKLFLGAGCRQGSNRECKRTGNDVETRHQSEKHDDVLSPRRGWINVMLPKGQAKSAAHSYIRRQRNCPLRHFLFELEAACCSRHQIGAYSSLTIKRRTEQEGRRKGKTTEGFLSEGGKHQVVAESASSVPFDQLPPIWISAFFTVLGHPSETQSHSWQMDWALLLPTIYFHSITTHV